MMCIDLLFLAKSPVAKNPALTAAVAEGLCDAPKLLDQLSCSDLVNFLQCPGDAPMHIMKAIFRPHTLKYWQADDDLKQRWVLHRTAYVPAISMNSTNIVLGPHAK